MKRLLIFALLGCAAMVQAQGDKSVLPPEPPLVCNTKFSCLPGEKVEVEVDAANLKDAKPTLTMTLGPSRSNAKPVTTPVVRTEDGFSFFIPKDLDEDSYSLGVKKSTPVSGAADKVDDVAGLEPSQISVVRPVITAVSPGAAFLADDNKTNTFSILGKGFLRGRARAIDPLKQAVQDNSLKFRFTVAGTPVPCGIIIENCYELHADSDQQITLKFIKLDDKKYVFAKAESFVVSVDGYETAPSSLTLIKTTAGMPITIAVIGFLLIVLIVFLLLKSGDGATKRTMNGKEYWLSVLFYDVQTNSYSLSKCQFYAWTGAAVIGYLFLAISKSVVQGSGVFPDIPPGLPGILIASVGTVVVATGITSAKGDKGAGNPGPNLSDFIASGGVIAPDRLQFAIWTIIGIGTFLSIVLQSDPRNINDLPTIPSGFLQLMGISSAGYLAGKLVRKAGPTISAIVVTSTVAARSDKSNLVQSVMTFELTGSGLSRSALFSIDNVQIFPDKVHGKTGTKGPDVLQQDPSINDLDFARVLSFSVDNPPDIWRSGPHDFTITNPDAQKAVIQYRTLKITSATITAGTDPTKDPATIAVIGECLDSKLSVKIQLDADPTVDASVTSDGTTPLGLTATATNSRLTGGTGVTLLVTDSAGATARYDTVIIAAPAPALAPTTPTPTTSTT